MSPWCTSRAIPNLGSSPCPSRRPPTAPSTTGSGGASRLCSRTSRPAASAWRTARSSAPSAWTACFWSWRWPCSGPSRPACGMPSTAPRPTKKSPSAPAPQPPPRPDLALQARHPTTSGLPATSRSAAAAVERVGELMGGKDAGQEPLAFGQGQAQAGQVGEVPGLGDLQDIGAVLLSLGSEAHQSHGPGHAASTPTGKPAREYRLPLSHPQSRDNPVRLEAGLAPGPLGRDPPDGHDVGGVAPGPLARVPGPDAAPGQPATSRPQVVAAEPGELVVEASPLPGARVVGVVGGR